MDLPKSVGVMILPSVNLFPHAILPLFIFEPRYRRMLQDALATHRMFCVAMQQPEAETESPARVAGLGIIRASVENPDGTSNMILQGVARVSVGRLLRRRPYRVHTIQPLRPESPDSTRIDALAGKVRELVGQRFRQGLPSPLKFLADTLAEASPSAASPAQHILRSLGEIADAGVLADLVSCTLLSDPLQRQTMLETIDLETRLRYLIDFLLRDLETGRTPPPPPEP
jgi:Lon protease-like protein